MSQYKKEKIDENYIMSTDGVISVITFKDIEERVFVKLSYEEVVNRN